MKLFNPWGNSEYCGDWSSTSIKMNKEINEKLEIEENELEDITGLENFNQYYFIPFLFFLSVIFRYYFFLFRPLN